MSFVNLFFGASNTENNEAKIIREEKNYLIIFGTKVREQSKKKKLIKSQVRRARLFRGIIMRVECEIVLK